MASNKQNVFWIIANNFTENIVTKFCHCFLWKKKNKLCDWLQNAYYLLKWESTAVWNHFLVLNNIWFPNFKSWLLNKNLLSSSCLCTGLSSFLSLFKMGFQLYRQPPSSSFSWNFKMDCTYIMLPVSEIAEHMNFKDL